MIMRGLKCWHVAARCVHQHACHQSLGPVRGHVQHVLMQAWARESRCNHARQCSPANPIPQQLQGSPSAALTPVQDRVWGWIWCLRITWAACCQRAGTRGRRPVAAIRASIHLARTPPACCQHRRSCALCQIHCSVSSTSSSYELVLASVYAGAEFCMQNICAGRTATKAESRTTGSCLPVLAATVDHDDLMHWWLQLLQILDALRNLLLLVERLNACLVSEAGHGAVRKLPTQ